MNSLVPCTGRVKKDIRVCKEAGSALRTLYNGQSAGLGIKILGENLYSAV